MSVHKEHLFCSVNDMNRKHVRHNCLTYENHNYAYIYMYKNTQEKKTSSYRRKCT